MKHLEDFEQEAIFYWASYHPVLRWLFSIPNGGKRGVREAARLKKCGVKSGVYDIFLPIPMQGYHGLFIELKRRKKDGVSRVLPNQKLFGVAMSSNNYKAVVCYGAEQAIKVIEEYMDL